jgi:predicted NAD/FAD-dependent oxidoreductase
VSLNTPDRSVLIVGAGISGLACARALGEAGIRARVVDRGRVVGGRMASRRLEGRVVDLGAAFFTAELASPFGTVVQRWLDAGLARPWTDTFSVSEPGHPLVSKSGPVRYAAPAGLRSLVVDLAEGIEIELEHGITSLDGGGTERSGTERSGSGDTVVLAMPDPQARRLLADDAPARGHLDDATAWAPTIAVAMGWPTRRWDDDFDGAFVNGSPTLTFLADDGRRRGDGAPVLVAHSSPELAAAQLDEPDAAVAPMVEAVRELLGIAEPPIWSYAHRWTFARPRAPHAEPFLLVDRDDGRAIGVCGDGWVGSSSVSAAWTSGDALGRAIAARAR